MAFPPLLGWALSFTFSWLVVLMLLAWAMAFLMFSAVCLWVKTPAKRRSHIVPAIITYGVLAAVPGITLLAMRPQLLWWAIAFAPLASSAIYLVWQGRERSLGAEPPRSWRVPSWGLLPFRWRRRTGRRTRSLPTRGRRAWCSPCTTWARFRWYAR